ncbi:MAG TPA: heliorhodopsin HeR [Patescibacteria group bacterium]|nr:heliorhodopsin HeR [Patescibacteria group bacterium]
MATKKSSTRIKSKAVNAKVTKQTGLNKDVHQQLHWLHTVSFLAFGLWAVIAGAVIKTTQFTLNVSYLTKDELASQKTTIFASALRHVCDVDLRWLLVGILVLSMIIPLLTVTKLHNKYHDMLKARVQSLRWIDFAVTGALLVELVALLSGFNDILTLKLIAGVVAAAYLMGWFTERETKSKGSSSWLPFSLGLIIGGLAWAVIGTSLAYNYVYGLTRLPWYVYASAGAALAGNLLMAVNQYGQLKGLRAWRDYMVVERNYLAINLISKIAVASILIVGLR